MDKIKIVHHSKTVGFSGTDKTAQLFCKYLAKSSKYEPYIVYRNNDGANTRLDIVKKWIGDDHVIGYDWNPGKKGRTPPFMPESDNFFDVVNKINPAIVSIHRSGYTEWPGFKYLAPNAKWVEHNIFGYSDPDNQIDFNLYISDYIKQRSISQGNKDGFVLYNPVEQPALDMTLENKITCREAILNKFKIPHNAVLLGRVGRADNFDPISLRAFAEVEKICPEAWYIVINPCESWINESKRLGINNIKFGSPIIEDDTLSNFYQGLDIYAHARHDGECCPCNIQEAMMHGIPVVSHESHIYNGQSEIIGDAGFVVPFADYQAYRDILVQLILNKEVLSEEDNKIVRIRDYFGKLARRRAMRYFEAETITKQLEKIYDWVLTK